MSAASAARAGAFADFLFDQAGFRIAGRSNHHRLPMTQARGKLAVDGAQSAPLPRMSFTTGFRAHDR
ncbi:hypothetical protein QZM52_21435 [Burkholderia metallica]|uniref:Uncharacterized protein n=1 Tax=Burkholderia metallica TaxID=488729 RepID=A0ABT8PFG0_9BURK|nr:hypothetical protein [Burkholderia metallica]MDN7933854.1 hypothetical protein [Burkholderia metallica]